MRFSSKQNLELFWEDENGDKKKIIKPDDTNGDLVTISETTYVNASSNVSDKNNYEI